LFLFKTPRLIKWFYPNLIWNGERDQPDLFLTFDDGPVAGVTDRILDILKHFNIKATFFCVGENIDKHPGLFRRIHEEGHLIGNHTYHHLNGWDHPLTDYLSDIDHCRQVIEKHGFTFGIKLFRPPYGKIKNRAIGLLRKDYHIIMWDVLSYDFSTRISREYMLEKSIRHTEGGSIIIFHDSEKTKERIYFLISQYIGYFIDKNYKFSTIDRLILSNY
jgi:peptidoglycan/xylan/chitin deacetylase (PgdA/CDA1 family)